MSNRNPGYYQNRYPAIRCDFSPDDVDESNIGLRIEICIHGIWNITNTKMEADMSQDSLHVGFVP